MEPPGAVHMRVLVSCFREELMFILEAMLSCVCGCSLDIISFIGVSSSCNVAIPVKSVAWSGSFICCFRVPSEILGQ